MPTNEGLPLAVLWEILTEPVPFRFDHGIPNNAFPLVNAHDNENANHVHIVHNNEPADIVPLRVSAGSVVDHVKVCYLLGSLTVAVGFLPNAPVGMVRDLMVCATLTARAPSGNRVMVTLPLPQYWSATAVPAVNGPLSSVS